MTEPVDFVMLQVAQGALEPLLQIGGGDGLPRRSAVWVARPPAHTLAALKAAASTAVQFARSHPDLMERARVREGLRKSLLAALLQTLPSRVDPAPLKLGELAIRTREFLIASGDVPVYATDLCAALSLSERSLRRLFREVFGTSPARYLRVRRLHQARRVLRRAGRHEASVTDACMAFGFYDLGRFASDYRGLFGELPSQTLRKGRAR